MESRNTILRIRLVMTGKELINKLYEICEKVIQVQTLKMCFEIAKFHQEEIELNPSTMDSD